MELEELRQSWRELDARLHTADEKIRRMARAAAQGRIDTSRRRIRRSVRRPLFLVWLLPLLIFNFCRILDWHPEPLFYILFGLFLLVILATHIDLLMLLDAIDPVRQTAREAYAGTLRFRRRLLRSVILKGALAVPVIVWIGLSFDPGTGLYTYALTGFWTGVAVGGAIGIHRLLHLCDEIGQIQRTLHEMEQ